MWTELKHPRQVEFYLEFHEQGLHRGEDWMPMVRAVEYLQSQPYADEFFAFTSLIHFQVTTAPSYHEQDGHSCVGVTWDCMGHRFGLSFWSFDRTVGDSETNLITCLETELHSPLDALILRLQHS